jgi:hypothetical protein
MEKLKLFLLRFFRIVLLFSPLYEKHVTASILGRVEICQDGFGFVSNHCVSFSVLS